MKALKRGVIKLESQMNFDGSHFRMQMVAWISPKIALSTIYLRYARFFLAFCYEPDRETLLLLDRNMRDNYLPEVPV